MRKHEILAYVRQAAAFMAELDSWAKERMDGIGVEHPRPPECGLVDLEDRLARARTMGVRATVKAAVAFAADLASAFKMWDGAAKSEYPRAMDYLKNYQSRFARLMESFPRACQGAVGLCSLIPWIPWMRISDEEVAGAISPHFKMG